MSKVVRTVRFEPSEISKIEAFIKKNPFLDFSSLARLAINRFIENPNLKIEPVKEPKRRAQRELEV